MKHPRPVWARRSKSGLSECRLVAGIEPAKSQVHGVGSRGGKVSRDFGVFSSDAEVSFRRDAARLPNGARRRAPLSSPLLEEGAIKIFCHVLTRRTTMTPKGKSAKSATRRPLCAHLCCLRATQVCEKIEDHKLRSAAPS